MVGPALRDGAAMVTPWIAASALCSGLTTYYTHQAFTLGRRTGLLLFAMSIPAAANVALNLVLIPRLGLTGAMIATTASYGLGLAASVALGRLARSLPIPLGDGLKAGAATLVMAAVVMRLPALGGAAELLAKTMAGALIYALAAYVFDVGGLRGRSRQAIGLVRARMAT
jgi:O-antigen/teichoic acid export membrane protein